MWCTSDSKSIQEYPWDPLRKIGVSNGLCEHLRACEHCVYFCEHEQLLNFSCEQGALKKIQMASSEHLEYFELLRKFSTSRFLSFINKKRYFVVIVNNRAETFKLEQ